MKPIFEQDINLIFEIYIKNTVRTVIFIDAYRKVLEWVLYVVYYYSMVENIYSEVWYFSCRFQISNLYLV